MAVYSDADRVPLEALVRLTANEGFVTSVELLARRDAEPDTPSAAIRAASDRAASWPWVPVPRNIRGGFRYDNRVSIPRSNN